MAHILVLDDDPATVEVMAACFEMEDHEVATASTLAGGVERLEREPFDLVLTDLFARSFSTDALTALHVFAAAAPNTPVMVATGYAEAGQVDPAQYGFAAIILKPFDIGDLLARVQGVLAEQQARLKSLRQTAMRAEDHLQSAHERIGKSQGTLRRARGRRQPHPPA
jgi:DNA-binding NtrC family response regulator